MNGVLTRMLSFPLNCDETSFISSCRWALDTRSHTDQPVIWWKPFIFYWLKQSLSWPSFREQVCTIAPSPANSSTIACLYILCNYNPYIKKKVGKREINVHLVDCLITLDVSKCTRGIFDMHYMHHACYKFFFLRRKH